MPSYTSYKNYLAILKEKSKPQYLKKSLIISLAVAIFTLGTFSALILLTVKIGNEGQTKKDFVQRAFNTFTTGKNSLSDNLESFQVAGVTAKFLDEEKESSQAAQGYTITLSEEDKTIAKIESTILLLNTQKSDLEKQFTPLGYLDFKNKVIEYFDESIRALSQLKDEHKFAKDLILTLGADFYLPKLTQEGLWEQKDKEKVKDYYEMLAQEVQKTQTKIVLLSPPNNYQSFFKQQIEYLKTVENLSQNIITILSQDDSKDPEEATQSEKAYQLMQLARSESEELSKSLITERFGAYEKQDNLAKFSKAKLLENTIEVELQGLIQEEEFSRAPLTDAINKIKSFIRIY